MGLNTPDTELPTQLRCYDTIFNRGETREQTTWGKENVCLQNSPPQETLSSVVHGRTLNLGHLFLFFAGLAWLLGWTNPWQGLILSGV